MYNAYLAVCYVCNEKCKYCPCGKQDNTMERITPFESLINKIDNMNKAGIRHITVSGGEPTLHPEFVGILEYIQFLGIKVTILSNGENFSDVEFFEKLNEKVKIEELRLITTLHSHDALKHEDANQKQGSFFKTITGLKKMEKAGAKIIVKHCITKENYQDLAEFYMYIDQNFLPEIDIQLCSIDYVGIPSEQLLNQRLTFPELKPYIEDMFDISLNSKSNRKLYCINMPLCTCDPFYWKYFPIRKEKMYDFYSDPRKKEIVEVDDNVCTDKVFCATCAVKSICNGTYKTAFQNFGRVMVKPYQGENR